MTTVGWLATPQQLLLEAPSGQVFHDNAGESTRIRERLRRYAESDLYLADAPLAHDFIRMVR